ncbi:MAG: hypothetical protein JO236_16360 [Mycobacterium sp.]|uniref:hypothetical protein n=1 Tax=Mycobacterium sp. TaxID=1785 RepID=UPI001ECC1331|nr:hypothetical protein [Mycobacterium sp.]MBW0019102.1 hypothetical protein [Mycobacterium sp.]
MNIPHNVKRVFAATLLTGGIATTLLALGADPAEAAPLGVCPAGHACTQWCPGDTNPAGRPVPWDTRVCHMFYWDYYGVHDIGNGAFYAWSRMGW